MLTRRLFVTAAAATASVTIATNASATESTTPPAIINKAVFEEKSETLYKIPTADLTGIASFTALSLQRVRVSNMPVLRLRLTQDHRLYPQNQSLVIEDQETYLIASATRVEDDETTTTTWFETSLPDTSERLLNVLVPQPRLPAFPNDGIDDPAAGILAVLDDGQNELAVSPPEANLQLEAVSAWAAQLQVEWTATDELKYRNPSSVTVSSNGPASVPAGTVVNVVVDRNYVSTLELGRVGLPTTSPAFITRVDEIETQTLPSDVWPETDYDWNTLTDDNEVRGFLTLTRALAPGESVQFALACTPSTNAALDKTLVNAMISITAEARIGSWRRNASNEMIDLTPSGQPNLADTATGKI